MADKEPWGPRAMNERLRKTVEDQSRRIVTLEKENSDLKIELEDARKTINQLRWEKSLIHDREDSNER